MARHRDDLLQFDVPRDWEDRSVVAYAAPRRPAQHAAPNVVVTRDTLAPDEGLEAYADRQLETLRGRLRGLSSVERSAGQVDRRPAVVLSLTADGDGGGLHQRLLMVGLPDRRVATITLTASVRELAQMRPLFDRIVDSVRLVREGEPQ